MLAVSADTQGIERLVRVEVIMDEVRTDLRDILKRLDRMEDRIVETEDAIKTVRVGWKTLWFLGSFVVTTAGAVGALIAKWIPIFGGMPR